MIQPRQRALGCGCGRPAQGVSHRFVLRGLFATGLMELMNPQPVSAQEHRAQALVLTCMNFRFVSWIPAFLARQDLDCAYDWVALAGGSLALMGFPHPAEAEAFWDQLELCKQLHGIGKVIVIDHQDCGAYARVSKAPFPDLAAEESCHGSYLRQAAAQIRERYPELLVELYFMKLTGKASGLRMVQKRRVSM
ncbi:MAG: carbonic anhydrase [Cyanobacteriota bacterium]